MSCSSCQGCNNCYPCTTCGAPAPPPPPPNCPDPEVCEQVVDSQCVMYTGVDLPCLDGPIPVNDIIGIINNAICQAGLGVTYINAAAGSQNCITVTGTGSQNDPIVIGLNLKEDGGITCTPDGLAADTGTDITLADNSGLVWTDPSNPSELDTLYNTTQTGNSVQLLYNGGSVASQSASYWSTLTLVQVLDAILFPTRNPTYTPPTVSLTGFTPANPYEVGASISINFVPKAINNDAGGFNLLKVVRTIPTPATDPVSGCSYTAPFAATSQTGTAGFGIASTYVPLLPSGGNGTAGTNPNNEYSGGTCAISHTVLAPTGSNTTSTTSWVAQATHIIGPVKLSSNGQALTTAIPAGTITSSAVSVTGLYPIFYGVVDPATTPDLAAIGTAITTLNNSITKKLVDYANSNVRIDYCTNLGSNARINNKWFWVAIPRYNPAKVKVYTSWNNVTVNVTAAEAWNNLGQVSVAPPAGSNWGASVDYVIYRTRTSTVTDPGYTEFRNS